jgi:hypothetical protein
VNENQVGVKVEKYQYEQNSKSFSCWKIIKGGDCPEKINPAYQSGIDYHETEILPKTVV